MCFDFNSTVEYTIPWSKESILSYDSTNNYWLMFSKYGDLMKSSGSDVRTKEVWSIIDGSASNNTSSKLYQQTSKSDWCGIVYAKHLNKWIAYAKNGDIALLTISGSSVSWEYKSQVLNNALYPAHNSWAYDPSEVAPIAYKNGRFVIPAQSWSDSSEADYTAYSDDGVNWKRGYKRPYAVWGGMAATNEYFVVNHWKDKIMYSSDGVSWDYATTPFAIKYDDLIWNGNKLITLHNYSSVYATTDNRGISGWTSVGTNARIYTSYEYFKYGGGYYVRKGGSSSNKLRSSTSMCFSNPDTDCTQYTLPWSKNSALNYGPGYWLILTQYGDLLKSKDASATDWDIFDGSASNNTSSKLYKKSSRSDWCGICYGANIKKWVAYTNNGDIALLTMESTAKAKVRFPYIQSSNVSPTTSTEYTFNGQKTFFIEADQINEGSDGAYKLTVNLENIRLISAEITNRPYTKSGTGDNVTVTFSSLTKPARSSVLDFSSSSLTHNSTLVEYGTNTSGSRSASWLGSHDSLNTWSLSTTTANYLFDKMPYSKNDAYMYFYESQSSSIMRGNGTNNAPTAATSETELYTFDALTRVFFNSDENWPGSGVQRYASTGCMYLPLAGFTQPINAVLYNYGTTNSIVSSATDNYVSPSADFNRTVLKRLTTDACTKLKNDGARVYVVKYRKQANWGAMTRSTTTAYTRSSTAHSYTEIDNCATSSGGATYDVSTESDLKSKLDEIAGSIKSWAGYDAAK
jgi:hypothetical protein